jgi:hypothetical protein
MASEGSESEASRERFEPSGPTRIERNSTPAERDNSETDCWSDSSQVAKNVSGCVSIRDAESAMALGMKQPTRLPGVYRIGMEKRKS